MKLVISAIFVLLSAGTAGGDPSTTDIPIPSDKGLQDKCQKAVPGASPEFVNTVVKTFARSVCRKQGDLVKTAMATGGGSAETDALLSGKNGSSSGQLNGGGYSVSRSSANGGADMSAADENGKLVDTYALLFGLAPKESSCNFHCGADKSASNTGKEEEAGAFQVSANAYDAMKNIKANTDALYKQYAGADAAKCFAPPPGDKSVASTAETQPAPSCNGPIPDPSTSADSWKTATKCCPAFATEMAALVVRNAKKHNGPIDRGEAKEVEECKPVLQDLVKKLSDSSSSSVCDNLNLPNTDSAGGSTAAPVRPTR
jgi:hypothetical protein